MTDEPNSDFIIDYVTGRELPPDEHEDIRQQTERLLVDRLGYDREDIRVSEFYDLAVDERSERIRLDLVVYLDGVPAMLLKTARSSVISRERETLCAARLAFDRQVPLNVVTNGDTAEVFDTVTGEQIGDGLSAIPTRDRLAEYVRFHPPVALPAEKQLLAKRILVAYQGWKCPGRHPS